MTRRAYSDAYDPDLTHEDMGRPTRAEAERDAREQDTTPAPPCSCGRCLVCALRGLAQ